ncbi:MFS transporter [Pantoea sp. Ap-967]|uniref:MFS transporter n=1 Tax=Pantoea sp. Ap-967 TaxID=2608362 RepID=UPI001420AF65|nr:MFS transporter [Pantoea sp. Ap-967]NIE78422.1 MFS transporter [Pantoea sp. Ap-967]
MTEHTPGIAVTGRRPASLAGLLAAFGGLYATQGLLSGLAHEGLPVLLRAQGVGLDKIGLLSLLFLPTAIKFLWAARTDRIAGNGPSGRLRLANKLQGLLVLGMLLAIALPPATSLVPLLALLGVMMLVMVTQDIVTDGTAVLSLAPAQRGMGNIMQIGGSYLGYILGGGLWVALASHSGWAPATLYLAALLALCALPAWLLRRRALPLPANPAPLQGNPPSLRRAWQRPAVRWGMACVVSFQAPVRWFTAIMLTYLVDRGFDVLQVGLLSSSGIALSGIAGACLGGLLLERVGRKRMVRASLFCYLLLQLGYLALESHAATSKALLTAIFLAFCLCMAMGFVVLYSLMMDWASPAQAGTDYSVLQCTDALCALVLGLGATQFTHHYGYAASFAVACVLALLGLVLAPRCQARASAAVEPGQ